jgi:hypothetical protein
MARIANDFSFEDFGEHSLKNVSKPIRIYRLLGTKAVSAKAQLLLNGDSSAEHLA